MTPKPMKPISFNAASSRPLMPDEFMPWDAQFAPKLAPVLAKFGIPS
jgi:hypothetical protein